MDKDLSYGRPRVEYDAAGISHNCALLSRLCAAYEVEIAAVTKATGGNPDIAHLMVEAGIPCLADARLENIRRLRKAGCQAPVMLLRSPSEGEMAEAVRLADIFLLSQIDAIRSLAGQCRRLDKIAEIIVMVDLGDLREGVTPDLLPNLIDQILQIDGVKIVGLGTNLACHIGLLPDQGNMDQFVELAVAVEAQIGRSLQFISAGNSSALSMLQQGDLPPKVNHLRLGESLLLGRETAYGQPIEGARQDVFSLVCQVIELRTKPLSEKVGRGPNAMGKLVRLTDAGLRKLAVLNLGAVDTEISCLKAEDRRVKVIGYSSDHLIVDVTGLADLHAGGEVRFSPNYHALATAMSSPYLDQIARSSAWNSGSVFHEECI